VGGREPGGNRFDEYYGPTDAGFVFEDPDNPTQEEVQAQERQIQSLCTSLQLYNVEDESILFKFESRFNRSVDPVMSVGNNMYYTPRGVVGGGSVMSILWDREIGFSKVVDLESIADEMSIMYEMDSLNVYLYDDYLSGLNMVKSECDIEAANTCRANLANLASHIREGEGAYEWARGSLADDLTSVLASLPYTPPRKLLLNGALVLDTESLAAGTLVSSTFRIDGRDHDLAALPTDSTAAHGIATTGAVRDYALSALPATRLARITGAGPAPDIAVQSPGLSLDSLVAVALAHPDLMTLGRDAPTTLGTEAAPVVAYASSRVDLPAGHRGYGLLVADQSVYFGQGAEWRGLILVRGSKPELRIYQDGVLLGGAALTGGPVDLRLYDNAAILRSLEALGLAQAALDTAP
jgi:hypothetical protein